MQQHKQGPSPNLLQVWGHLGPTACTLWGPLVMNEKTEKWWDLPQAETGLHWDRASASPPWHCYREKRNLCFSTIATNNPEVMQLYKALSVSTSSLPVPCTEHQRNKLIYCLWSKENIYQHFNFNSTKDLKHRCTFHLSKQQRHHVVT